MSCDMAIGILIGVVGTIVLGIIVSFLMVKVAG
jgi:hypothetical protein